MIQAPLLLHNVVVVVHISLFRYSCFEFLVVRRKVFKMAARQPGRGEHIHETSLLKVEGYSGGQIDRT